MQAALQTLPQESGVHPDGVRYIAEKGIANLSVFATLYNAKEQLTERLIDPFITGVDIKGNAFKLADDEDIWRASILSPGRTRKSCGKRCSTRTLPRLPLRLPQQQPRQSQSAQPHSCQGCGQHRSRDGKHPSHHTVPSPSPSWWGPRTSWHE